MSERLKEIIYRSGASLAVAAAGFLGPGRVQSSAAMADLPFKAGLPVVLTGEVIKEPDTIIVQTIEGTVDGQPVRLSLEMTRSARFKVFSKPQLKEQLLIALKQTGSTNVNLISWGYPEEPPATTSHELYVDRGVPGQYSKVGEFGYIYSSNGGISLYFLAHYSYTPGVADWPFSKEIFFILNEINGKKELTGQQKALSEQEVLHIDYSDVVVPAKSPA